jgi:hypothetical protein
MSGASSRPIGSSALLSEAARAAALVRVVAEWEHVNWAKFKSRLRLPSFEFYESTTELGRWQREHRTLGLSYRLLVEHDWLDVTSTLEHEMAHQCVDELYGGEAEPHGPLYRKICAQLGIDFHARMRPNDATPRGDEKIIAKVRKLLSLAQSSNQHEAELAANLARKVIFRFNLDMLEASKHVEGGAGPAYARCTVGRATGRRQPHESALASLLVEHFFVRVVWLEHYDVRTSKRGSILELLGRPENLQIAEFVHDFVLQTAERLWKDHKRERAIKSDKDRRMFLLGVVRGFSNKLRKDHKTDVQEGLVWVPDAGLDRFMSRRHPRLTSGRSLSISNTDAYARGREAGGTIVLHKPVTSGSSGGSPRRAITDGK